MATVVVTLAQGVEKLGAVAIAETQSGENRIVASGHIADSPRQWPEDYLKGESAPRERCGALVT